MIYILQDSKTLFIFLALAANIALASTINTIKHDAMLRPFHYAFKVSDIKSTRRFYIDILGCHEGRSTDHWIDFDFWGNQLSAHVSPSRPPLDYCGTVDGVAVPIPHFGCIVPLDVFRSIETRLQLAEVDFIIPSQVRYEGKPGEQWTQFFLDYSGNPIELKAYTNEGQIFAGDA